MKISTSKLTSSKKDAATQLSALEDELENDPYSIPVNEALYTAAMDVGFPDLAAFALETVRQGHPGNKKMLHMLAPITFHGTCPPRLLRCTMTS